MSSGSQPRRAATATGSQKATARCSPTATPPPTPPGRPPAHVVAIVPSPDAAGYWLAGSSGGVSSYGDAASYGSASNFPLSTPIVAMAAMPDGRGYWLVAAGGRVFAYGAARNYGSATPALSHDRVAAMAAAADGRGYWLAASDGRVFAFGGAESYGWPRRARERPRGRHGGHARRTRLLGGGQRRRGLRLRRRPPVRDGRLGGAGEPDRGHGPLAAAGTVTGCCPRARPRTRFPRPAPVSCRDTSRPSATR